MPLTYALPSAVIQNESCSLSDVLRVESVAGQLLRPGARRQQLPNKCQRLLPHGMAVPNVTVEHFLKGIVPSAL